jgi:hypothetical protein
MLQFTTTDLQIIDWLRTEAADKLTIPKEKLGLVTTCLNKLHKVLSTDFSEEVGEGDITTIEEVLKNLDAVCKLYFTAKGITDLMYYEDLKKELAGYMGNLADLKDRFYTQATVMEEYSKKEYKARITTAIVNEAAVEDRMSYSRAEKLVEEDARYIVAKKQSQDVKKYATSLRTRYDYYDSVWQSVRQTISVLGKERYSSGNS